MRSRDGNLNFSLAICSVIFFSISTLCADEYLISYRYIVKDATLYNEKLHISKAMKKCKGTEKETIFLNSYKLSNLKKIIEKNSESFIDYIHKLGLHVDHKEITINLQNHPTTILTSKTRCFKVNINDNFAKITALK
jgi:hypothetical protein